MCPTCSRALRALTLHVPRALRAFMSLVPRALRVLLLHVPRALRALVPTFFKTLGFVSLTIKKAYM